MSTIPIIDIPDAEILSLGLRGSIIVRATVIEGQRSCAADADFIPIEDDKIGPIFVTVTTAAGTKTQVATHAMEVAGRKSWRRGLERIFIATLADGRPIVARRWARD